MKTLVLMMAAALLAAGCAGPEATQALDTDIQAVKARIAEARAEQKGYGADSLMHELLALRIGIESQTLAMLEQKRAAGRWGATLAYTVDGRGYVAPAGAADEIAALESRLVEARAKLAHEVKTREGADPILKPLITMSSGTSAILVSQLEYRLAARRHAFPAYYAPFPLPAAGATPPQAITTPPGGSAPGR